MAVQQCGGGQRRPRSGDAQHADPVLLNGVLLCGIADHIRSSAFLICDGVLPSNEGRGYVLRRIIRRALRHGHKLGQSELFFHRLVDPLVDEMGGAYPELVQARETVAQTLLREEEQFSRTLADGMRVLDKAVAEMDGNTIPGETVFHLYDTHGFPPDLTNDVARERGLDIDMDGFEACMERQREQSRNAGGFANDYADRLQVDVVSDFTGYERLEDRAAVTALYREGEAVDQLAAGEEGMVVLEHTPFYPEGGGQVGDTGKLTGTDATFRVQDTRARQSAHLHIGRVEQGTLNVGDRLAAHVDMDRRHATMRNHSATHLLHAALKQVLGDHVQQKGSLVAPEYLRFDFSHGQPLTADQLREIEAVVNRQVLANTPVETQMMSLDEAKQDGAVALFGEKYATEVRVLSMGEAGFSKELCGGTHVGRTGDIGLFRITDESGSAAGVRRLEAVTGEAALDTLAEQDQRLGRVATAVRAHPDQAAERVEQMAERLREQDKEIERLKQKLASGAGGDLAARAEEVNGVKVLATQVEGADGKTLRTTLDKLKDKLGSSVILLAAADDDKVALVAGVTKDLTDQFNAGELVRHVAEQVGGKGGGRSDMAQGGGSNPEALPDALASVSGWIAEKQS